MAQTISQKLRIQPGFTLRTLHAPSAFKSGLTGLPAGVKLSTSSNNYDQVHWFVQSQSQLKKELSSIMKLLKPEIIVWVYYPKKSSGVQTDLSRDKGWDCLLAESDKVTWISLISFDDTWSVFGFRGKSDADKKKEQAPKKEREVFQYVNPKTKEVRLPAEFSKVLDKNKKAASFFETLSFTGKKEYIEWIITAKREETKAARLKASIERLSAGYKTPV